ncbi:hypothetical protein NCCP28_10170 [Niallia sp. NCCP-28]|nr:hypothetical protein NCCP28_10170 [Niallia sp. NCCP-28]
MIVHNWCENQPPGFLGWFFCIVIGNAAVAILKYLFLHNMVPAGEIKGLIGQTKVDRRIHWELLYIETFRSEKVISINKL